MQDLVKGMMRIGLTEYEARAYIAIVSLGEGSIAEISQQSEIPRARVYDIMERLSGKGFVETANAKPVLFRANDPNRVFAGLIDDLKKTSEEIVTQLNSMQKKAPKNPVPVWTIHDDRGIDVRVREIIDSSKKYILFVAFSSNFILQYARPISAISGRTRVRVMTRLDAKDFGGLLGYAEVMPIPEEADAAMDNGMPKMIYPTSTGERTARIESFVISDTDVLVIIKNDDARMAYSIEDPLMQWSMKVALGGNLLEGRPISIN